MRRNTDLRAKEEAFPGARQSAKAIYLRFFSQR
jgi:hypothetical protein